MQKTTSQKLIDLNENGKRAEARKLADKYLFKNREYKKGQQIAINQNFSVSIGVWDTSEVAIISNNTGDFVKQKQTKISPKLRKVKRVFKPNFCCNDTFCFSGFNFDLTKKLINILK